MQGASVMAEPAFASQRRAMVDGQIRPFDVTDTAIIRAFTTVPRERFIPEEMRSLAYSDAVLTLKGAPPRALLQPMHLARLLQGAVIQPADRALVVAGGSGYTAAILAHLVAEVVTLEADPALSGDARAALAELGLHRTNAVTGGLAEGHAPKAPYDVIVVPGAVETKLDTLFRQLAPGGRLVAIVAKTGGASRRACKAILFQKFGGEISERFLFDVTAPVIADFQSPSRFVF